MAAIAILIIGGVAALVVLQIEGVINLGSAVSSAASDVGLGGIVNLSAAQIAPYAQAAGFEGDDLATAIAVALAESSGNPNAYNPETAAGAPSGKGSFGLWQIYLNAHPEYEGQNLNDPQTNANAAFAIYQAGGNSFGAWSTFNSGAYEAYLDQASQAVNA